MLCKHQVVGSIPSGSTKQAGDKLKIKFMSYIDAKKLVPFADSAIICMSNPGSELVANKDWSNSLTLHFEDVDSETNPKGFKPHHAIRIIQFVDRLPKEVDRIYVHCLAGVSRSAAVAKFLAEKFEDSEFLRLYQGYTLFNKLVYSTLNLVAENLRNGGNDGGGGLQEMQGQV